MRMVPLATKLGSLFKDLGQEFKKILKVSSPGNVIKSVIWGQNLLNIMHNLLKTLEREEGRQQVQVPEISDDEPSKEFVFINELLKIAFF